MTNPQTQAVECGFWKGHKWSQWVIMNDGKSQPVRRVSDNTIAGLMYVQHRNCIKCGLSQFKEDTIYAG